MDVDRIRSSCSGNRLFCIPGNRSVSREYHWNRAHLRFHPNVGCRSHNGETDGRKLRGFNGLFNHRQGDGTVPDTAGSGVVHRIGRPNRPRRPDSGDAVFDDHPGICRPGSQAHRIASR